MKLADVAQKLGCRLEGPPEIEIHGVAGIEYAESGQITFLANRRYFPLLDSTRASAVFIEEGIKIARHPDLPPLAALRTPNPYLDNVSDTLVSNSRRRAAEQARCQKRSPVPSRSGHTRRRCLYRL